MDTGAPWTCVACGAGNAGYRRRCIDCGAKRPAEVVEPVEPVEEPAAPAGPVDVNDIPMPRIAKRRRRGGRRWPGLVVTAIVLVLAAYGAVQYLTTDRPSAADDEAALRAAVPADLDLAVVVSPANLPDVLLAGDGGGRCSDHSQALLALLGEHATVTVDASGSPDGFVSMQAFDTASAADRFDQLLRGAARAGCGSPIERRHAVVVGRVRIEVGDTADPARTLTQIADQLELEG